MQQVGRLTRTIALATGIVVMLTACGPAAATVAPSTPAASTAPSAPPASTAPSVAPVAREYGLKGTWDEILAAAKTEKTLNLWVHGGAGYEAFAEAAKAALPDLDIQVTSAGAGSQAPKVALEQQGGVYNWDIVMAGNSGVAAVLNPIGATVPIRPFFDALPADVQADADWSGGFHVYANPDELNWVIQYQLNGGLWLNKDEAGAIDDADDLLDPKYKGKIVINDPTTVSAGSGSLSTMLVLKGEEYVRKLLKDQQAIVVDGAKAVHEALEDGRAWIGIGGNDTEHAKMQADGLAQNIIQLKQFELFMYPNIYAMSVFKNIPHPNATAVFMNWALSQEGMEAWASETLVNGSSRRVGTTRYDTALTQEQLESFPSIGGTYLGREIQAKVFAIANE